MLAHQDGSIRCQTPRINKPKKDVQNAMTASLRDDRFSAFRSRPEFPAHSQVSLFHLFIILPYILVSTRLRRTQPLSLRQEKANIHKPMDIKKPDRRHTSHTFSYSQTIILRLVVRSAFGTKHAKQSCGIHDLIIQTSKPSFDVFRTLFYICSDKN